MISGRPTAPDLAPVRAQWERGEHEADALTGVAEAAVEEWRYTKSGTYRERDLQPLWREREGVAGGRLLASPPRNKDHDAYGLDSDGRVVLVRRHYGGETSRGCVHFEAALAQGYDYDWNGRLAGTSRYTIADQRVTEVISYSRSRFGEESWRRERYDYGPGPVPTTIVVSRDNEEEHDAGPPRDGVLEWRRHRVHIDDSGEVIAIFADGGDGDAPTDLLYAHLTPEAEKALERTVLAGLVREVRAAFAATDFDGQPWALAVRYQSQHPIPPEFVIGLIPPGNAHQQTSEDPADWDVSYVLALSDPELLERCAVLRQSLLRADDPVDRTWKLAERLAAELAREPWPQLSHGKAAAPFSVFAIPVDPDDP